MIYFKKIAMLIALVSACQIESACSNVAKKVLARAGAVGGIATVGSLIAYKVKTHKLLADPDAKQALKMLNDKNDCKITFGYYQYYSGDIEESKTGELTPREAFKLSWILSHNYGDGAVLDLRVCSGDSCVDVTSITRRVQIEPFLRRVDSVEAPIFGFNVPVLRRLINRITNP